MLITQLTSSDGERIDSLLTPRNVSPTCSHFAQVALFHSLGLVPMSPALPPIPLGVRRVVLLVPESGLTLMRSFNVPEVFLSLSGTCPPFENHFVSVHMAYVRVRRGCGRRNTDAADTWWSLGDHLAVQDSNETDPDAELMVSAVVPDFALDMAPAAQTELQLRPRDSMEMFSAPKDVLKRLGGQLRKVFYRADLANTERTAILVPGDIGRPRRSHGSTASLACPEMIVLDRRHVGTRSTAWNSESASDRSPTLHRTVHGKFMFDQSIELTVRNGASIYRVNVIMANGNSRELLADGGMPPVVDQGPGSCSVRVKFGGAWPTHVTYFPFPVEWKSIDLKFSKRQGYFQFTVLPLEGPVQVPFSMSGRILRGDSGSCAILPSSWCFPPCVPLRYLPKLDFKAEWSHDKVRCIATLEGYCCYPTCSIHRPLNSREAPPCHSHTSHYMGQENYSKVCHPPVVPAALSPWCI